MIFVSVLNIGVDVFDNYICSSDILDVEKYLEMVFKLIKWYFEYNKLVFIDGLLIMKGVMKFVILIIIKFGCYMSLIFKVQVCGGDFVM